MSFIGCHFWLGNDKLGWQSANNFAEGISYCVTFIEYFLITKCFRQMLRLFQGAHATTYQPTGAESQIRWFAWASWQVVLILARLVIFERLSTLLPLKVHTLLRVILEALQWLKMETTGKSQVSHPGEVAAHSKTDQEFMLMLMVSNEMAHLQWFLKMQQVLSQLSEIG